MGVEIRLGLSAKCKTQTRRSDEMSKNIYLISVFHVSWLSIPQTRVSINKLKEPDAVLPV